MKPEEKQVLINRLEMEGLYIRFKAAALENRYRKCTRFLKEAGYSKQEIPPILEFYMVEKYPLLCRLLGRFCNNYMYI